MPIADALLPAQFDGRYYEPFVGGGSLFFALAPRRASLGDSNPDLISAYVGLRDETDRAIEELRTYPHEREFFLGLRDRRPKSPHECAARLIYLNKTAFNGLYRVNREGGFNVPFGDYKNPTICNTPRLREAARTLAGITLSASSFAVSLGRPRKGDFVYLDPPYITGHTNNGFLKYNARLFSWGDQLSLAAKVTALAAYGVRVAVSNADHPSVAELYRGLYAYRVNRRSNIGGGLDYRGRVSELLLTSFPLFDVETSRLP